MEMDCRVNRSITRLLASHFRMPERKVNLTEEEKDNLLYLMVDGTECPIQRCKKTGHSQEKLFWEKEEAHKCASNYHRQ